LRIKDIEKRKGVIKFSRELFFALSIEDARMVFKDIFIIRSENDFFEKIIIYQAYSPHFAIVDEGLKVFEYLPEIERNKDGKLISAKWIKQR